MHRSILSHDTTRLRLPAHRSPAILAVVVLWLIVACALPLYQLQVARRQARQDLQHLLTAGKPDGAGFIAAFDRSNRNIDAAASGPCLLLAVAVIFLVNRMLRLERRYGALAHELSAPGRREAERHEGSHWTPR